MSCIVNEAMIWNTLVNLDLPNTFGVFAQMISFRSGQVIGSLFS